MKDIRLEMTCFFTEKELEQIRYALEYLHDADLSDFDMEDIRAMESVMKKLGMKFYSQLPSEFDSDKMFCGL